MTQPSLPDAQRDTAIGTCRRRASSSRHLQKRQAAGLENAGGAGCPRFFPTTCFVRLMPSYVLQYPQYIILPARMQVYLWLWRAGQPLGRAARGGLERYVLVCQFVAAVIVFRVGVLRRRRAFGLARFPV